jgi:hypothetical protein
MNGRSGLALARFLSGHGFQPCRPSGQNELKREEGASVELRGRRPQRGHEWPLYQAFNKRSAARRVSKKKAGFSRPNSV